MPIYEYECPKCGVIEVTQRITEPSLAKCPTCKKKVSRLISATSFQLKGEGWYVTDYARKGKGEAKGADTGSGSEGSSASDSKGDSKSDSKADSKGDSKSESKSDTTSTAKSETKSDKKASGGSGGTSKKSSA